METCKECGKEYGSIMSLARHFSQTHKLKAKDYYDRHLKKAGDGECVVCSGSTSFENVSYGYTKTCGHSCAAKEFRKDLKRDDERFKNFRDKVIKNQSRIWSAGTAEERSARGLAGALACRRSGGTKQYDWESIGLKQLREAGVTPDHSRSYDEQAQELISRNIAIIFGINHG